MMISVEQKIGWDGIIRTMAVAINNMNAENKNETSTRLFEYGTYDAYDSTPEERVVNDFGENYDQQLTSEVNELLKRSGFGGCSFKVQYEKGRIYGEGVRDAHVRCYIKKGSPFITTRFKTNTREFIAVAPVSEEENLKRQIEEASSEAVERVCYPLSGIFELK